MSIPYVLRRRSLFNSWPIVLLLCLSISSIASAATYYVSPTGSDTLSTSSSSPGSLRYAAAYAPGGSKVILENGAYDGSPNGFTISVSGVTFQAQNWRKAIVENSTSGNLLGPASNSVIDDTCEGIVFGPSSKPINGGWSGGGGDGWVFRDCEFTHNDGVGFGNHSLVEHCLFTDQWWNSFDVNGVTGFIMRNCIVRRGNRGNGDSDSIGDKEDFSADLTFDGLIAYDNNGPALWFDTNNTNWVVKNCTLFANHGGNNWYNLGAGGGESTTQFYNYSSVPWGSAQDQAGVPVGALLMCVTGTPANIGAKTKITHIDVVSDNKKPATYKFIFTVAPALPATPANGDDFAVQAGGASPGYGLMSEANPNGSFIDNVTYNNTDAGFFDADSGDGYHVNRPGIVVTGNLFVHDGIAFRSATDGGPYRKLAAATVEQNEFKIGSSDMQNAFHWHDINPILGFPKSYYHIDFDHNTYDPGIGHKTAWGVWYIGTGKDRSTKYYNAFNLPELQNPATFDQDQHSVVRKVAFRGRLVHSYIWPAANDTDWSHIYFPNNKLSASGSIHQVDDDETPYIQTAVTHAKPGRTIKLTVFGHTPILGDGPYTSEVYDYSGRWILLELPTKADVASLESQVPGYAVLNPSHITATLTSTDQYALRATYKARGR